MTSPLPTPPESLRPLVGVAIMIWKENQILLGRRINSHGAGEFAFPGGHLEYMEGFADCAVREIAEECGIEITNLRFHFLANVTTYVPKHYVHIGMIADWQSGEPQLLEPDKSEAWGWYALDQLPTPLLSSVHCAIESYRTGKNFFDTNA